MTRETHTPGPWFAAAGGVIWHESVVGVSHPECCGDFGPNGECCGLSVQGYHEELAQEQIATCAENDADLIAAAPDLLEALEGFLCMFLGADEHETAEQYNERAEAAIERAKAAIARARGTEEE